MTGILRDRQIDMYVERRYLHVSKFIFSGDFGESETLNLIFKMHFLLNVHKIWHEKSLFETCYFLSSYKYVICTYIFIAFEKKDLIWRPFFDATLKMKRGSLIFQMICKDKFKDVDEQTDR